MYTSLVILLALAACAATAPADDVISPIVNQSQENPNPDGSYKSSYEAGNGTKAEEEDHLEDAGIEDEALMTERGFSTYFNKDTQRMIFEYQKYEAKRNRLLSMGVSTTSEIPLLIQEILQWRHVPFG